MLQTILFATDGSSCSQRAMHFVAALARSYHTRIVVVHAFLISRSILDNPSPNSIYGTRDQAEVIVERASAWLKEMGISEVETKIVEGPAVNVILGAADTYHPDVLVIGARGQSLWPGFQLGSVSMAVTQRAECPVLVVK